MPHITALPRETAPVLRTYAVGEAQPVMRRRRAAFFVSLGGLGLAALVVGFFLWSRFTELGVFAGGGGRYWVQRAAEAEDDSEARKHLQRVLSSTQYGVNIAQNAVKELPVREDRVRLWRILIEIAPNDIWRRLYSLDLEREIQGVPESHNPPVPPDAGTLYHYS